MPRIIGEPRRLSVGYELVVDLENLIVREFCEQYFDRIISFLSEPAVSSSEKLYWLLQMTEDRLTFGGTIYGRIGVGEDSYINAGLDKNTIAFRFVLNSDIDVSKLDLASKNRELARRHGTA